MRILRGLSSKFLPCGCLTGIYETYDGQVVGILDAKSGTCTIDTHQNGKQLPGAVSSELHAGPIDSSGRAARE
jgi:hypothetical protein